MSSKTVAHHVPEPQRLNNFINRSDMGSVARFCVALLWLAASLYPGWASATYVFTYPSIPGGTVTAVEGINDTGTALAWIQIGGNAYSGTFSGGGFNPLPLLPPAY